MTGIALEHPQRLCVLSVNKDPDLGTIVDLALGLDPDIRVLQARSIETAVQMLLQGLRPNVVLIDTNVFSVSGVVRDQEVRNAISGVSPPIIFLTAAAFADEVEALRSAGAAGVITKPFNPLSLAIEVKEILRDDPPRR